MTLPLAPGLTPDMIPDVLMRLREVDFRLGRFERGFLSEDGIKEREWYRHLGVAPGKWTGYGATRFPALSEAIEIEHNATLAQAEVGRLVEIVETLISTLTLSLTKQD
jgi:N-acetylated-alpha-linked acidic dipeptidase